MWFLTKVWIPFWLLVALAAFVSPPRYTVYQEGEMAMVMFAYGAVAALITCVYGATRIFRRATSDAGKGR